MAKKTTSNNTTPYDPAHDSDMPSGELHPTVCLIRCVSSGVFVGIPNRDDNGKLVIESPKNNGEAVSVGVTLTIHAVRRIWRWKGANTMNELSVSGSDMNTYTRITKPILSLTVFDAVEVIPCTVEGANNLTTSRWLND